MTQEKYKIEVTDESVEIRGTLTIREAFDFLSFFEREGYTTLEDWGDQTTLYLRKRDLEKEITNRVNKEVSEDLSSTKLVLQLEQENNERLKKRISELESLIYSLGLEESHKIKQLTKRVHDLERYESLLKLKNSPQVDDILCKNTNYDFGDQKSCP